MSMQAKCILLAALLGCSQALWAEEASQAVAAALHDMLAIQHVDRFVIVEDSRTQKYVQFATLNDTTLFMDIPLLALSPTEQQRAGEVLGRLHMVLVATEAIDPNTNQKFRLESYQRQADPEQISELAQDTLIIFTELYQLADPQLNIIRGWE